MHLFFSLANNSSLRFILSWDVSHSLGNSVEGLNTTFACTSQDDLGAFLLLVLLQPNGSPHLVHIVVAKLLGCKQLFWQISLLSTGLRLSTRYLRGWLQLPHTSLSASFTSWQKEQLIWSLQFILPHEGQGIIKAHSHSLQLILLASFTWPQEEHVLTSTSGLPALPTKFWSQIDYLLTLQRSLECPREGFSTSVVLQGLPVNPGDSFFCTLGLPGPLALKHTTLSTLYLVMMVTLTTLGTRLVDHFF